MSSSKAKGTNHSEECLEEECVDCCDTEKCSKESKKDLKEDSCSGSEASIVCPSDEPQGSSAKDGECKDSHGTGKCHRVTEKGKGPDGTPSSEKRKFPRKTEKGIYLEWVPAERKKMPPLAFVFTDDLDQYKLGEGKAYLGRLTYNKELILGVIIDTKAGEFYFYDREARKHFSGFEVLLSEENLDLGFLMNYDITDLKTVVISGEISGETVYIGYRWYVGGRNEQDVFPVYASMISKRPTFKGKSVQDLGILVCKNC